MTDQQINEAIAKACPDVFRYSDHLDTWQYYDGEAWMPCKDGSICRDLNAMHEAENILNEMQWKQYFYNELSGTIIGGQEPWCYRMACHSTARQRAEALGITLGLWKEGE